MYILTLNIILGLIDGLGDMYIVYIYVYYK